MTRIFRANVDCFVHLFRATRIRALRKWLRFGQQILSVALPFGTRSIQNRTLHSNLPPLQTRDQHPIIGREAGCCCVLLPRYPNHIQEMQKHKKKINTLLLGEIKLEYEKFLFESGEFTCYLNSAHLRILTGHRQPASTRTWANASFSLPHNVVDSRNKHWRMLLKKLLF